MATTITAVQGNNIAPITLIDLQLGSNVYYLSSNYKAVTYDSNSYTELGALLNVSEVTDDLKHSETDIQITLTGIPAEANYLQAVLNSPVKGGNVVLRRGFVDTGNLELITGQVYTRYSGVITNFTINEELNVLTKANDYAVTVVVSGLVSVLANKINGQKTNPDDRKRLYPADRSFNRVPILYNTTFDFGKEYTGGSGGYGGSGGGGRGGGGGGGRDRQMR